MSKFLRGTMAPESAAVIAQTARLRAQGFSWRGVSEQVGRSVSSLHSMVQRQRETWNAAYSTAMTKAVSEIRELAGTQQMLPIVGEFLAAAEHAESFLRERGESLFLVPEAAITDADGARHTIASFFERYYLSVRLFESSPHTINLFRACIRRWQLLMGNPTLSEITNEMLARFRDALLKERRYKTKRLISPITARNYLKHVQILVDAAGPPGRKMRDAAGFIEKAPWARPPRCEMPEPKTVPFKHLAACYEAAAAMELPYIEGVEPAAWWRALLAVAYNTGLRRRSLFGLRWSHVDFDEGLLRIPSDIVKANKRLLLPMNVVVVRHLRAIETDREHVFEWSNSGEWFGHHLRRLQTSAGILTKQQFGLHRIRKTTATMLWKHDPAAAQLMLGHAALAITQQSYVNAVEALAEAVNGIPQPDGFGREDAA